MTLEAKALLDEIDSACSAMAIYAKTMTDTIKEFSLIRTALVNSGELTPEIEARVKELGIQACKIIDGL